MSALTESGRFRGRPVPPGRGTAMSSMSGTSAATSASWPGVRRSARTRPRPPAAAGFLLLTPPRTSRVPATCGLVRDRAPPFGLRPRAGGPDDGRIDLGVPVPVALGIGLALQRVEDLAPGAVFVPQREPVVAGLPRPVLARDGPPGRAVPSAPEDPVDD